MLQVFLPQQPNSPYLQRWSAVNSPRSVLLVGHPFAQAATQGHATGVMFAAAKSDYNFPVRVAQLSWEMMREAKGLRFGIFFGTASGNQILIRKWIDKYQ